MATWPGFYFSKFGRSGTRQAAEWLSCPFCSSSLAASKSEIPIVAMHFSEPSSASSDEGRFPSGSVLGERYRVIELLGRVGSERSSGARSEAGTAGCVEFLPPATTSCPRLLERFRMRPLGRVKSRHQAGPQSSSRSRETYARHRSVGSPVLIRGDRQSALSAYRAILGL